MKKFPKNFIQWKIINQEIYMPNAQIIVNLLAILLFIMMIKLIKEIN